MTDTGTAAPLQIPYERVLVTGGSGLVGRAMQEVTADSGKRVDFVGSKEVDLRSQEATREYVRRTRPNAIIHLAALSGGVAFSRQFPATMLRDNIAMNTNVLEAARLEGVEKVVMTLSTGMYPEDAPNPIVEDSIHDGPPHESNYGYSFAKRLVEPSIRAYREEYGLNAIGLVPNGIYGKHGDFSRERAVMVAALIRRCFEARRNGTTIEVWGDGSALREYTYAADLARAYLWCLANYDEPQILHVGGVEEHSVRETAFLIADLVDLPPGQVRFDVSKPGGIHRKSTSNNRFVSRSQFEYTPFQEGLCATVQWFSENYDVPGAVKL